MKKIKLFIFFHILFSYQLHDAAQSRDLIFSTINSTFDNSPLNVVEAGKLGAKSFLFIHGNGQSYHSWIKQLSSDLGNDFHLVAFDLRGHGNSAKPSSVKSYNRACIWGEDIQSIILKTKLTKPVLVGWSLGGLMVMHYVNCFGLKNISGIVMVSSRARLVSLTNVPSNKFAQKSQTYLQSSDFKKNILGANIFTSLLTKKVLDDKTLELLILTNLMAPPYVRKALRSPILNEKLDEIKSYDFLLPKMVLPFKVVVGAEDAIRNSYDLVDAYKRSLPGSDVTIYEGVGHSPFLEDPLRFNDDMRKFIEKIF